MHVATHPGLLVDAERISLDMDTDLSSVPCTKLLEHVGHLLVKPVEDHRWSLMLRLRVELLLVLRLLMLHLVGVGERVFSLHSCVIVLVTLMMLLLLIRVRMVLVVSLVVLLGLVLLLGLATTWLILLLLPLVVLLNTWCGSAVIVVGVVVVLEHLMAAASASVVMSVIVSILLRLLHLWLLGWPLVLPSWHLLLARVVLLLQLLMLLLLLLLVKLLLLVLLQNDLFFIFAPDFKTQDLLIVDLISGRLEEALVVHSWVRMTVTYALLDRAQRLRLVDSAPDLPQNVREQDAGPVPLHSIPLDCL